VLNILLTQLNIDSSLIYASRHPVISIQCDAFCSFFLSLFIFYHSLSFFFLFLSLWQAGVDLHIPKLLPITIAKSCQFS